ncbi:MAG: cytochrome bc complex cytochrome b subunit [Planctomycetes bacterium]|nr:cytochrome bc complex cytochrome b subunit [Planctomycetota bacterium]
MGLAAWLQERLPVTGDQLRELTNEPVPNHLKRWWFALGGTPAYLFVVQIVTGILLAFYYEPAPSTAYDSVKYITDTAAYGWFFRSVHKWAATLMIAAVILHQMRVFFTGAYRKPREINWLVGMCLLLCTLVAGFTGYSLVYEQLSYWGTTVGANISSNVPVVGNFMKRMLLGGDVYNERTLSRLYIIHAAIMPALTTALIAVHIAIIRMQGVTELKFEDEPADKPAHFSFFPDHLYTEIIAGLVLMILLSALSTVLPATLGPRADPLSTPEVIKPEWFFYVTFRWLKLFSGTFAVLSMGFIVFTMYAWPFVDALIRKKTRFQEASVWIGIVAVLAIIGLTVWEAVVAH